MADTHLVILRNISDRLRMPYDCNLGHGLPVEPGESGKFHPLTAQQLLREEPGAWEELVEVIPELRFGGHGISPPAEPSPTLDAAPPAEPVKE